MREPRVTGERIIEFFDDKAQPSGLISLMIDGNDGSAALRVKMYSYDRDRAEVLWFPEHNRCQVTFAEKPARAISGVLKAADYTYSGGAWRGALDRLPSALGLADV